MEMKKEMNVPTKDNQTHDHKKSNHFEFEKIENRPPFTLEQLRTAIPKECFERNWKTSLYYFFKDWFLILSVYLLSYYIRNWFNCYPMILYPIFWMIQGTLFWALFVIGHDCGHGSFSTIPQLNHFIGHLCHIPILVPYHSWRISHHSHHSNAGNITKDETYRAMPEDQYRSLPSNAKLMRFHMYPIGGWMTYLITGMPFNNHCHFWPFDSLFEKEERRNVMETLTWYSLFCIFLGKLIQKYGIIFMLKWYFMPVMIFGAWIAIVTLLHHTHPEVPWYRNEEWNFLRGSLSTVDRNYGILEPVHHNIGTHIVHHLFMKIPHYHLKKANKAIKPLMGKYYRKSDEFMVMAMIRIWKSCRFVPNSGNVVFYEGIKSAGLF